VFAEYVEGGSLKNWIENKSYMRVVRKGFRTDFGYSYPICLGLHYAHEHEQKLIHQDVKPANVMMAPDGTAKVTDFGGG